MSPIHGGDTYGLGSVSDFSSNVAPSFALPDGPGLLGWPKGGDLSELAGLNSAPSAAEMAGSTQLATLVATYPDPQCRDLRAALAARYAVPSDAIVCGNGASDLIYRIVAAVRPHVGATLECTFGEYAAAMRLFGAKVVAWPTAQTSAACCGDDAMTTGNVGLYFVCNPNNPTSQLVDHLSLVELATDCERTGAVLVVDECFMEFVDDADANTLTPLLATHQNLIVLRAFTKSYALPGIRLGYAMCGSPQLAQQIVQSGPPWSVSGPALSIGLAALEDHDYLTRMRRWITAERPRFVAELAATGVDVYPAQANFVLFRVPEPHDPEQFFAQVLDAGFLLRRCTDFHDLDERHFRCAIKTQEENNRLLATVPVALNYSQARPT